MFIPSAFTPPNRNELKNAVERCAKESSGPAVPAVFVPPGHVPAVFVPPGNVPPGNVRPGNVPPARVAPAPAVFVPRANVPPARPVQNDRVLLPSAVCCVCE